MAGTEISQLSERKILGGNLHALPVNIFSDQVAYVALGHLHKAQAVGKREWVRYSGAPIPLSMNERLYQHEVRLVILEDGKLVSAEPLSIPRFVRMKRLKRGPLDEVLAQIAELDDFQEGTPDAQRPYLDIPIVLEKPLPDLRRTIEAAMKNKHHRLVNIEPQYTGHGRALGDGRKRLNLKEMKVEEVFVSCYQRHHEGEPSPELMALFNDLAGSAEEL